MSDYITVTDHYIKREDGSVTRVRMHGKIILEVDYDCPVVFLDQCEIVAPQEEDSRYATE